VTARRLPARRRHIRRDSEETFRQRKPADRNLGVDILFVISGLLITRSVLAPDFSIGAFDRPRIRRIFPALSIVPASTVTLGELPLPRDEPAS
jgi:peptidoglycan/LPS O-acetylase OafA/YrhL